jgi:oxygen-dependent protoporphyrinogen oxidase
MPKRIIVVGGGISGLGAAWHLQKQGASVRVLEAHTEAGGRMRSREFGGAWIDLGAEFIATPGFEESLFEELDILKDRLSYPGGDVNFAVWRDGQAHMCHFTKPTGILSFSGLTFGEKLSLLRVIPEHARMIRELGGHYDEVWRGAWADDESVQQWLGRKSPALLEYIVEPMFELYCGWEPEVLSKGAYLATTFLPRLPVIWTFKKGLGTVTRALASRLDVLTSARVTKVDLDHDPVQVEWEHAGARHREAADGVVIAVPGSRVLDFTQGLTAERRAFFEKVEYVPHELPFFKMDARPEGVPDRVFYPRKEDTQIAALGYDQSSTNPDVKFLRVSMKTGHIRSQLGKTDAEDLAAIVAEANRRYPSIGPAIRDGFVSRWREAIPLYPVGALRRLAAFVHLPPQRRVAFAGDYLYTASTAAAYQTGKKAATDLLSRLG